MKDGRPFLSLDEGERWEGARLGESEGAKAHETVLCFLGGLHRNSLSGHEFFLLPPRHHGGRRIASLY